MHKLLIGAAAAALVALTPAFAESPAPRLAPHPGTMDKTETRAEVKDDVAAMFARADANKDGYVTTAEMDAMYDRQSGHRQDKMAGKAANFDPSKAFARLDLNHDGKLTRPEVEAVFAAARPDSQRGGHGTEHLFARADTNRDGFVTLAEFQAAPRPTVDRAAPNPRGGRFHFLASADINKDGRVSLAEAQRAALAHFNKADTNRDGKVTPEERRAAFKGIRPT